MHFRSNVCEICSKPRGGRNHPDHTICSKILQKQMAPERKVKANKKPKGAKRLYEHFADYVVKRYC